MDNKSKGKGDPFKLSAGQGPDAASVAITEALNDYIVISAIGFWWLLKSFFSRWAIFTIPLVAGTAYGTFYATKQGYQIYLLHQLAPDLLTYKRLSWLYRFSFAAHYTVNMCCVFSPLLWIVGAFARSTRTKFQKIFQRIGLTNGLGDTPKLIYTRRIDKDRKMYAFDSNGLSLDEFEAKRNRIEADFKSNVESIKTGKHNGQIIVTFTKLKFPSSVLYADLAAKQVLPKESLYLGMTVEGIKTQKVAELPHMLIAGTTGSGKSVFFKQALLGLLESSPHLQMYLIDLKGGLEMIDFVEAPNVKVIKSMDHAVHLLGLIEKEMKNRFSYLENSNRKQIIPEEDKKDRIVVAVDEGVPRTQNQLKAAA